MATSQVTGVYPGMYQGMNQMMNQGIYQGGYQGMNGVAMNTTGVNYGGLSTSGVRIGMPQVPPGMMYPQVPMAPMNSQIGMGYNQALSTSGVRIGGFNGGMTTSVNMGMSGMNMSGVGYGMANGRGSRCVIQTPGVVTNVSADGTIT